MKDYKTVWTEGEAVLEIEKSKFIAHVLPIKNEAEALMFIERIKKMHWDATHNVPVYVLGANYQVQRYSDDGEPSGTAGIPVLEMIKHEGITDICVVITRYFGGIKLGTGGLVRAYTQSAKEGLHAAQIVEKRVANHFELTVAYHLHGKVQNALLNMDSVILHKTDFAEAVTLDLYSSPTITETLHANLVDLTSNQMVINHLEDVYITLLENKILQIDEEKGA